MLQPNAKNELAGNDPIDLTDKDVRVRVTPAALKALFRIIDAWQLTAEQGRGLLGGISSGKYGTLRQKITAGKDDLPVLKMDELQRISFLIGITKALRILHSSDLADKWVRLPNRNPLFSGQPPVDYAIRGGIPALANIRKLLDARRGFLA